jgi:hypothetical protein
VPGEIRIILNGVAQLRGATDRLISFQNPHFNVLESVSKNSPNVKNFAW